MVHRVWFRVSMFREVTSNVKVRSTTEPPPSRPREIQVSRNRDPLKPDTSLAVSAQHSYVSGTLVNWSVNQVRNFL